MNIFKRSRPLFLIVFGLLTISCAKQNPGPAPIPPESPKPRVNDRTLIQSTDVAMDLKQGFPRFVAKKALSLGLGIAVKFELEGLEGIPIQAREDFLVPFSNGQEIWNGQWPMNSPEHYKADVITTLNFTPEELSFFESRLRKNPEIGQKDLTFVLRVVFSDSVRVTRTTLAVIEVPLIP